MNSNLGRAALGVAVLVIAVVLLIVLKDNGSNDESSNAGGQGGSTQGGQGSGGVVGKTTIPTIVVRNGHPVGGVTELTYNQGDRVRFKVSSDVGDEVHVHGYDIAKDVKAGGSVGFDFPASIEGVFEGELEGRKAQILELRVNP
jgi:hypothetical protein